MGTAETDNDKRTLGRQSSRRRSRSPNSSKGLLKIGKKSIKGLITGKSKRNLKGPERDTSASSTLPESTSIPSITEDEKPVESAIEPTVSEPAVETNVSKPEEPITTEEPISDPKPRVAAQDDETVYGMQLDDQSAASSRTPHMLAESESKEEEVTIQVVLLIMDPKTRRFELLQLEFNPEKALTSDVIAQIKTSATEKVLTNLEYVGICDSKGNKLDGSKKLKTYCPEGNEILMALPKGMDEKKCTKLAAPILKDPNVLAMIKPGSSLSSVKEDKSSTKETEVPSENLAPVQETVKTDTKDRSISQEPTVSLTGFKYCLLIVIILSVAKFIEMNAPATKALETGDTFAAGDILSKCGVWDLLRPPQFQTCDDPMTLKMGEDGVLTLYNGGPYRLWEGDAGHLPLIEMKAKNILSGEVTIADDGAVLIDGVVAKISFFDIDAPTELAPWPFKVELPARNGKKKVTGKK